MGIYHSQHEYCTPYTFMYTGIFNTGNTLRTPPWKNFLNENTPCSLDENKQAALAPSSGGFVDKAGNVIWNNDIDIHNKHW